MEAKRRSSHSQGRHLGSVGARNPTQETWLQCPHSAILLTSRLIIHGCPIWCSGCSLQHFKWYHSSPRRCRSHFYQSFPADGSNVLCPNIRIAQFSDRPLREGAVFLFFPKDQWAHRGRLYIIYMYKYRSCILNIDMISIGRKMSTWCKLDTMLQFY